MGFSLLGGSQEWGPRAAGELRWPGPGSVGDPEAFAVCGAFGLVLSLDPMTAPRGAGTMGRPDFVKEETEQVVA